MEYIMDAAIEFTLAFDGAEAKGHQIDFYDVSQALIGFQRSLALTTHLVVNGEIITQAPSLMGARILTRPPEDGSWKITALILAGAYAVTTAPKDTPLGHIIHSTYDYVISESLGFHVDYDKTLGQLYEEHKELNIDVPKVEQHQVDSLIEKCSKAITEVHRPIFKTHSATQASIQSTMADGNRNIGGLINLDTYSYIHEVFVSDQPYVIKGRITSYNSNTYKGRIYVAAEGRPVAFELSDKCRSNSFVQLIVSSLSVNAVKDYKNVWSHVFCKVYKNTSRSGHLKSYTIVDVSSREISNEN